MTRLEKTKSPHTAQCT